MKIHVLVEGPSEKAFIEPWGRRAFRGHDFIAHKHQGKGKLPPSPYPAPDPRHRGLLDQLPASLRAFARANEPDVAIVVLVDVDDEDCVKLKERLVAMKEEVAPDLAVVFRIAIEETEAFYLGDLHAITSAYPEADVELARTWSPDSICGTAELFGQVIGDGGMNKVAWAEAMATKLTTRPERNRSPSFKAFHHGIQSLIDRTARPGEKRTRKHWRARTNEWRKK